MLKDPTNPNHHKYVIVNKYQRKKEQSKNINVLVIFKNRQSTFNDTENFRNLFDYDALFYRHHIYLYGRKLYYGYYNNPYKPNYLNSPGCKIVYDDVHHTSYKVVKNGKFIREGNFRYTYKNDKIKHFKRI